MHGIVQYNNVCSIYVNTRNNKLELGAKMYRKITLATSNRRKEEIYTYLLCLPKHSYLCSHRGYGTQSKTIFNVQMKCRETLNDTVSCVHVLVQKKKQTILMVLATAKNLFNYALTTNTSATPRAKGRK